MAGERILIVEDEGVAALSLEAKLRDLGYEPAGIAFSAAEALRMSLELTPDLILMDIKLSGEEDGIDAALRIRQRAEIPIIYVTAFSDDLTLARAKNTSPFGYLVKPLREELIKCTVEMALEKYRLERQLKHSEARFRAVFAHASAGMAILDARRRVVLANPCFGALLDRDPGELLGQNFQSMFSSPLPHSLETDEGLFEISTQRLGGDMAWYRVQHTKILDADGTEQITICMQDVSERKRSEAQLIEAKVAAEEQSSVKSEWIAHLSHELRAPLSTMIGYADLLTRTKIEDDKLKYIDRIRRCGRNLIELTNEVLDFSQFEAGQAKLTSARFDLLAEVREVVALLEIQAKAKGLELIQESGTIGSIFVQSDPLRVRQILINLVGNAIKFTERGKIGVEVRLLPDQTVIVRISDTGCGIAREDQKDLFRPFMRFVPGDKSQFPGTGLGLSLSRKLAQALGGSLLLEHSEIQVGSSFVFSLPIVRTPLDIQKLPNEVPVGIPRSSAVQNVSET